jgi:hypothetical protein
MTGFFTPIFGGQPGRVDRPVENGRQDDLHRVIGRIIQAFLTHDLFVRLDVLAAKSRGVDSFWDRGVSGRHSLEEVASTLYQLRLRLDKGDLYFPQSDKKEG